MTDVIWPLAPADLNTTIMEVVGKAASMRKGRDQFVYIGANQAIKALNKGRASLILLAADTKPVEILLQFPLLCETKDVPYVWVSSGSALGRAAGISRATIAVALAKADSNTLFGKEVESLITKVEGLNA